MKISVPLYGINEIEQYIFDRYISAVIYLFISFLLWLIRCYDFASESNLCNTV